MSLKNLKSVFSNLPKIIIDDLGVEQFNFLWYPFSGIDMAPLNIFDPNNRRAIINDQNTRVFFYTDNSYNVLNNGYFSYQNNEILDGTFIRSNYQDAAPSKLIINSYLVKLKNISESNVRLNIFQNEQGLNLYCFFIPSQNFDFELFLIEKRIKIKIVCNAGGYGIDSDGAIALKNLNVNYTLGEFYTNSNEISKEIIEKYESNNIHIEDYQFEQISIISWGLDENRKSKLKRII